MFGKFGKESGLTKIEAVRLKEAASKDSGVDTPETLRSRHMGQGPHRGCSALHLQKWI